MIAFVLRRLAQSILVLLIVGFVSFSMFRFIGDPINNMMGQEATLEQRAELARQLGLDQPFPIQFARFIGRAATGDFGVSYRLGRPVMDLILERLPATLELAFVSALLAFFVGVSLGVYTAIRPRGLASRFVMTASLVGVSLPTFLIGIGLIYLFAVELGWLPSFGRGQTVQIGG
jgi:peptide/nickel transport system permease protein